jgi:sulfite reductase (NADPH) hemoprotein beta-component
VWVVQAFSDGDGQTAETRIGEVTSSPSTSELDPPTEAASALSELSIPQRVLSDEICSIVGPQAVVLATTRDSSTADELLGMHLAQTALAESIATKASSEDQGSDALLAWAGATLPEDVLRCIPPLLREGGGGGEQLERLRATGGPLITATLLGRAASRWVLSDVRTLAVGEDFSGVHFAVNSKLPVKFVCIAETNALHESFSSEVRTVKDVGLWAMEHGAAYVASCSLGRGGEHQLQSALREASEFPGPSLVLVLPSLPDGVAEEAVASGAWPLYRWDPSREDTLLSAVPSTSMGLSPALTIDSKCVLRDLQAFVDRHNNLSLLSRREPLLLDEASGLDSLQHAAQVAHDTAERSLVSSFRALAEAVGDGGSSSKERLLVLFGSDGGKAAGVARRLAAEATRRGFAAECKAADEWDPVRLVEASLLLFVVSTAGQGEQPMNSKEFVAKLQSTDQPELDDLRFAVVALGDSHYWPRPDQGHYFNKAGRDVFVRLEALGATPVVPLCLCDEQHDDGFEEALKEWIPLLWEALGVSRAEDRAAEAGDEPPAAASSRTDDEIKLASNYLRGTLATTLEDRSTGAIPFEDTKLTKFAGIYMQDDRDLRSARRKARLEPAYSFMIRARIPGGVVNADQWLTFDKLCDMYGNGTFKLTTRQAFQLHGVLKRNLKATIRIISSRLMDTIAACGDVSRNVMVSALPSISGVHREVVAIADAVSAHLKPQAGSTAYYEIFLDKKPVAGGAMSAEDEGEPIYGATYLPRKFKISFAVPPLNDVDLYAHCLNFVAIVEHDEAAATDDSPPSSALPKSIHPRASKVTIRRGGRLVGFNIMVGGGMGMTHGNTKTFPRLAEPMGFCTPDQVCQVAEAVVTVQRDYGDRVNRKHARLKYTIDDRGVSWFRNEVEERLGFRLAPVREATFTSRGDQFGWAAGEDGKHHLTLFVQNGRVRDDSSIRLRTALREIATAFPHTRFVLTANQNVVLSNLLSSQVAAVDKLLADHGVDNSSLSGLRLNSMACVALPSEYLVRIVHGLC